MILVITGLAILAVASATLWITQASSLGLDFKKPIAYLILTTLLLGSLSAVSQLIGSLPAVIVFLVLQVGLLFFGILHSFLLNKLYPARGEYSFPLRLGFTVLPAAIGAIIFLTSSFWQLQNGFLLLFTWAYLFFPLPFLILYTFHLWSAIPDPEYKCWHYPTGKDIPIIELGETIDIMFQLKRVPDERSFKQIAVRTPINKPLGELFHYFIYRHNTERDPAHPIAIGTEGEVFGWNFYKAPGIFSFRSYLDPQLTIEENKIRERTIIMARQIPKTSYQEQEAEGFFANKPDKPEQDDSTVAKEQYL